MAPKKQKKSVVKKVDTSKWTDYQNTCLQDVAKVIDAGEFFIIASPNTDLISKKHPSQVLATGVNQKDVFLAIAAMSKLEPSLDAGVQLLKLVKGLLSNT